MNLMYLYILLSGVSYKPQPSMCQQWKNLLKWLRAGEGNTFSLGLKLNTSLAEFISHITFFVHLSCPLPAKTIVTDPVQPMHWA